MRLLDLNQEAVGAIGRARYVLAMHGTRGHNIESAALNIADAGLRILGDGLHVARVFKLTRMFDESREPQVIIKLTTGAVVLCEQKNVPGIKEGNRVVVRVDEDGRADIARVLE
jgi:hypothetical protein